MKKQKALPLILLLTVLGATSVFAAVSFDVLAENLRIDGSANAPNNSLVLLVADTNQDGFDDFLAGTINIDDFIDLGDDMIIGRFGINYVGSTSAAFGNTGSISFRNGWGEGDPLGLLWLPTLPSTDTSASIGDAYGFYTHATGLDGSSPWFTPADGTAGLDLVFLTTDAAIAFPGSNPTTDAYADAGSVVPEPQTFTLLLGGMIGLSSIVTRKRLRQKQS